METDSPLVELVRDAAGTTVRVRGIWLVQTLAADGAAGRLRRQLESVRAQAVGVRWDLRDIVRIDHFGALLFWDLWGKRLPQDVLFGPRQEAFFDRLYHLGEVRLPEPEHVSFLWIRALGAGLFKFTEHALDFMRLIGQLSIDLGRLLRQPHKGPWKEVSANVFHAGTEALGITALVGFLIGVVLSFLSAQQLRTFGADIYIVNILGMSIIRELGPLLAAILVAGRSGSAITAQIGVMRVTEELDAMLVMGIPHGFRLILPRVIALAIAMPLIVLWTDAMALIGGMASARTALDLSFGFFIDALPEAVPLANLWLGLAKGVVFGILIALTACHFGLRIEPNTTSLGRGTTSSVVTSITIVILADAVFAIAFKNVGLQ